MKNKFENSLQVKSDWKQSLESAQILLQKKSLQEQSDFLVSTLREVFHVSGEFWFAHPHYPLPEEDAPQIIDEMSDLSPVVMLSYKGHTPHYLLHDKKINCELQPNSIVQSASLPVICENILLGVIEIKPMEADGILPPTILADIIDFLALCAMPMQIYRLSVLKNWRVEQLSIVRKISDRIANITDLDSLCSQVTDVVRERFSYYFVAIFICEDSGELCCRSSASADPSINAPDGFDFKQGSGIIGWVVNHKEEILVEDVHQHPFFHPHEFLLKTRSEAAFPLMIGDRMLGVLDVQADKIKAFHEMDLVVLRTLADNIAIAVEGARLFSGLNRRTEQISTVFDISHALSSILDFDLLMDEVVKTIQQRNQYLQVNVYTVHSGRGKIIFRTGTGERSQAYRDAFLTFNIDDEKGILPWVAREEKTFVSNDVRNEPLYRSPVFMESIPRSEISVPLITGGEIVGILDIQSDQENAFDANDVFFFEALSAGIATAIRNATLFRSEQFRRQVAESVRDIAGILSNSSSLEELINRILEKLRESLPCDAASIWLTSKNTDNQVELTLAVSQGLQHKRLSRINLSDDTQGKWINTALNSDEPVIRIPSDQRGLLGEVLNLPSNYSAIAAPLRAGGDTVGLITLVHHQPDRYGAESRLITQTFAGYAAAAIKNNQLFASVREQAWISAVLLKVAEVNRQTRSLDDLIEKTVNLIPELIGCSSCAAYLFNQPLNIYERKAACGFEQNGQPTRQLPGDQAAFQVAHRLLSPVTAYFSRGDFLLSAKQDSPVGIILPLVIREQILGVVWVGSCNNDRPFSDENLKVLTGISNQTATAINNLLLLENQQQDAYITSALLQVAQTVAGKNDLPGILNSILDMLSAFAGIETSAVFLKNPSQPGFRPVTAHRGLPDRGLRSLETYLFPGDFPLLDKVTENADILLAPLNPQQRMGLQWTKVKHQMLPKEAFRQKPQEGGWLIGIPLHEKDEIFGALVLLDKPISGYSLEKRLDLLNGIGGQITQALQNDRLQNELRENEKLQQEFQFARNVQQTFLPRELPNLPGWDMASLWEPANQVGGDFFDLFIPRPGTFCAVIADVSDKGMPAALYMAVTRTLIRSFAQENITPGDILTKVNDLLLQDNPAGMFVTAVVILGDSSTGLIQYANAGHNPPIIFDESQQVVELPRGQIALGVVVNQAYQNHSLEIQPNSYLILYTDGVTDTLSPSGADYSLNGLKHLISANIFKKANHFTGELEKDLTQFRAGLSCVDDVTVLTLHRL